MRIIDCLLLVLIIVFEMGSTNSLPAPRSNHDNNDPENIMKSKDNGTCPSKPPGSLRWGCDPELADKISCHNRHYAEHSGYLLSNGNFLDYLNENSDSVIPFYDSISGNLLFSAPKGRSMDDFIKESKAHGWPSFRDAEVNWENVRVLGDGETVSVDGTHLGHNLPDGKGNRYCINLVSVAGHGCENPAGGK